MNEEVEIKTEIVGQRIDILWACMGLGAFWVIFLWGFWTSGIYALGVNASVFLAGLAAIVYSGNVKSAELFRAGKAWTIPISLMCLSYSLFENPFIKLSNIVVIPISFSVFYRHTAANSTSPFIWTPRFVLTSILTAFLGPQFLIGSIADHYQGLIRKCSMRIENSDLMNRIALGLFLLLGLSLFVVLPLLSSADLAFSLRIQEIANWFCHLIVTIFNLSIIGKITCLLVISVVALAVVKFSKRLEITKSCESQGAADSIISGIVVGGISVVYVLFIWVQLEQLWFNSLPAQFLQTERLVKGGFWQLVAVSLLNILLFTWCYRRTDRPVQIILSIFTPACLVLVLSAANKMWLYITTYGLSYEKFYAFYTVIFCLVVFLALLGALVSRKGRDIVKFTCFLFLWMYGVVTVMPVEVFVLKTNMALSKFPGSRLVLDEMTMLSSDVLSIVESDLARANENERVLTSSRWTAWNVAQSRYLLSKPWYELNLSNVLNGATRTIPLSAGVWNATDNPLK